MNNRIQFLFLPVCFTVFLVGIRVLYSESLGYVFLVWNLWLAIIPFLISYFLARKRNKVFQLFLFVAWILFFPNALYIITDLVHLRPRNNIPIWFDSTLIFSAAISGLFFAYASLLFVESYLQSIFNKRVAGFILFSCLLVSSFGVYVGRFLRWNSWDIFLNPLECGRQVTHSLISYPRTWVVTLILFMFFSLIYVMIKKYPAEKPGNQS